MQTASGNRGAAVYTENDLDNDYRWLKDTVKDETAYAQLPPRDDTGMFTKYLSFNLRDQMRAGDSTPLQFRYEPSDCRLFYTPYNIYNMSRLWRDAAAATWNNTALCVADSTGYSQHAKGGRKLPPKPSADVSVHYIVPEGSLDISDKPIQGLVDGLKIRNGDTYAVCNAETPCDPGYICRTIRTSCTSAGYKDGPKADMCLRSCNNVDNATCKLDKPAQSAGQLPVGNRGDGSDQFTAYAGVNIYKGYRPPGVVVASMYGLSCSV
jgi:hypothetical protein